MNSLGAPSNFCRELKDVLVSIYTQHLLVAFEDAIGLPGNLISSPDFVYCCLIVVVVLFSGFFWRIHQMDPYQSGILFGVMTLVSTYLVAFAYKNVKFLLKHK